MNSLRCLKTQICSWQMCWHPMSKAIGPIGAVIWFPGMMPYPHLPSPSASPWQLGMWLQRKNAHLGAVEGKLKPAAPASCSAVFGYVFIFSQLRITCKLIHRKHRAKWAPDKVSVDIIHLLLFFIFFEKQKIITVWHMDLPFKKNIYVFIKWKLIVT